MIDQEPAAVFAHLRALTDRRGIFEHARFDEPREDHGYCIDDAARALIVVTREADRESELGGMADTYLGLVERAVVRTGHAHNRLSRTGRFIDDAGVGDWWGRALWALGVVSGNSRSADHRRRASTAFRRAASARSVDLRAMAFAALGAAALVDVASGDRTARSLLVDASCMIEDPSDPSWLWPEPRLRYANAVIPEMLLAAGTSLGRPELTERGLAMLNFLLEVETANGHLSVTGIAGRGPFERDAQFDQQPIEAAAIADACARAFGITGAARWRDAVALAWGWFDGDNDARCVMFDAATGAGFDGLTRDGRNDNRGAESTLAFLSTYQHARRLGVLRTVAACL